MKKIILSMIACFACVGIALSVALVSTACKKKKALVLDSETLSAEDIEAAKHFTFAQKTFDGVKGYMVVSYKGGLDDNCVIPETYKGLDVLEIGSRCFYQYEENRNILSVTLPSKLLIIGDYAFSGCSGLNGTLTIPNSVIIIKEQAFFGCSGLTGPLTIPNSVTTIGEAAFNLCSGLNGTLTIPNSVTTIGWGAFFGCSGLTGDLTIPNSVETIGDYAFYGCSGFTGSLTIPNSVTKIGNSAFYRCSGLTGQLTIPNSVTTIGDYAFFGCSGLVTVTIDSESIANQLTNSSAVGDILSNCTTLYLKDGITATESVTTNYSVATSDKTGYTKYVKNT